MDPLKRSALLIGVDGQNLALGLAAMDVRERAKQQAMEPTVLNPATSQPKPDDMPTEARSWRENEAAMLEAKAQSPLPTRQLKRMAARALAKELSKVQNLEARRERIMTAKRDRAMRRAKARINAGV